MAELRQYTPIKVVGSFATPGPFGVVDILDGVVDGGEFAAFAFDNATWTRERDLGGNATRVKSENDGGTLTITLSASSPTNTTLSGVAALDRQSEDQVGALLLKDLNGNTVVEADGCFITRIPGPSFGSDRGSRQWVFECASIRSFIGGHDIVGG